MAEAGGPDGFTVLGPVGARLGGAPVDLGAPRQRALLAILLAAAGEPVTRADLTAALWGDSPPRSATEILYRYVNGLRDALEPERPSRSPGRWIRRTAGSYRLAAGPAVDAVRFRELAARRGEIDALIAALARWRGPVAEDLDPGVRQGKLFQDLERERNAVVQALADAALADGRVPEALEAVRRLASAAPIDESLHAELIHFLVRAGHETEAAEVYAGIRDRLGRPPGPELRAALPPTRPPVASVRPAQLPAGVPAFSGRTTELAALTGLTADPTAPTGTVVTITGMAGVGKTALALHWAHAAAPAFPDGQLYVNLRGFDPVPAPLDPAEVLHRFLEALGVASADIPGDTPERAALFRRVVARRRILILLDNARDADQVQPLLPGAPGCLVLVTSRTAPGGLMTSQSAPAAPAVPAALVAGARSITLDLLDGPESERFLADRIGAPVVATDPAAVAGLVTACGGLPLALAIVAARIAVHPGFRLADVAAELGGTRAALSVLATGPDADVRTAFSWSYRILSPAAARLFRELAVHPGPEVGVTAVASTAGVREEEARRLLAEIAGAQLIRELRPGRWGCHDLLRAYAVELLAETDGDGARRRATERMVDHYRQTAATVMPILRPEMPPMSYGDRLPGVTPEPLADRDAVLAWYDAEHPVLLPVLRLAYADGLDPYVYELAWGLMSAQDLRGHFRDWIAANELGLAAATRAGRRWWIAVSLLNIARGLFLLEDFESSLAHNRRALPLLAAEGDRQRLAHVHLGSSAAAFGLGRFDLAAEHVAAAAALYREIGDLSGAGWAEYNLGSILSEGPGGAAAALPHMLAGWELHRQAGNVFGEATIGRFIARLRAELGEHAAAVEHLRRSAELFGDFRQPFEQAKTLDRLGTSLVALGRPDAAREAWSRANELVGEDEQPDADRLRRRLKDLIETG